MSGDYQHTPGPWIGAGPSFGDDYPHYTTEIITDTEIDDFGVSICQLASRHFDRENEANAALISAAPELLAALVDVLPYAIAAIGNPRDRWPADSVILRAETVVDKATTPLIPSSAAHAEHDSDASHPAINTEATAPFCGIDIPAFLRKHGFEETQA